MNFAKLTFAVSAALAASALAACTAASTEQTATSTHADTTGNTADASVPPAPPPAAQCISAAVPAAPKWNPPPATAQTVCTAADLKTFNTAAQTAQTWDEIVNPVKAANAACASCIFTHDTDAAWGPIVLATDGSGGGFVNWGSCFAKAAGGSNACGQAYFDQNDCANAMCASCTDDASFYTCAQQSAADTAACGQYNLATACNGAYHALDTACSDFAATVAVNCGGH